MRHIFRQREIAVAGEFGSLQIAQIDLGKFESHEERGRNKRRSACDR